MRMRTRILGGVLLGFLLLLGTAWEAAAGQAAERGLWDQLAQWVVPRFIEKNDDFASIISQVRKASCHMDVELTSAALEAPLTGAIQYAWEDINDSGMLSEREAQIEVTESSGPQMNPFLAGLRQYLEDQTLFYFPFLFQINDIRAVKIPGGYKLRLRPAAESAAERLLGYSVAYLTLTDDFRATEMRTESERGVETVYRFKHRKVGERWLSAGFLRRITTPTARAEEDRTEVYETVSGVPLLREVTTDTFVATSSGAARVHQKYNLRDWQVEKRDRTMVVSVLRAEGIMKAAAPREFGAEDFRLAKTLTGHGEGVLAVAWSPDGQWVASAGMDKTIKLWEPATGKCAKTLTGHATPVNCLAFLPDGKRLVSGGGPEEGSLRVWDLASEKVIKALEGGPKIAFAVACSPDGKRIVAAGEGGSIAAWDAATYQPQDAMVGHLLDVYSLAYTPPNAAEQNAQALLITGSADMTARVWKVPGTTWPGADHEDFGTFKTERQVAGVAASWNGERIAAAGTGNVIQVWETATGRPLHTLEGHGRWIECLAFAPVLGSVQLVSGSRDRTLRLWDCQQGKCLQMLEEHDSTVRAVAYSPDGNQIASASDDKTVKIWARTTGVAPPPKPAPPAKAPEPKAEPKGAPPKK